MPSENYQLKKIISKELIILRYVFDTFQGHENIFSDNYLLLIIYVLYEVSFCFLVPMNAEIWQ